MVYRDSKQFNILSLYVLARPPHIHTIVLYQLTNIVFVTLLASSSVMTVVLHSFFEEPVSSDWLKFAVISNALFLM